jgi:hypothetical protein
MYCLVNKGQTSVKSNNILLKKYLKNISHLKRRGNIGSILQSYGSPNQTNETLSVYDIPEAAKPGSNLRVCIYITTNFSKLLLL